MARGKLRVIELSAGVEGLELTEGAAKVHLKKDQGVFYNPVQCFNRDISTAVINEYLRERKEFIIQNKKSWEQRATILEALAASGLRSIRYALELDDEFIKEIVANDISKNAIESIRMNAQLNGLGNKIRPNMGDAVLYMYQCKSEGRYFDVVDLDPYGCAAKFLDPAVQAVQNGGLLCVTATDMAILCGNTPETCRAKYGSVSLRGKFCHEMALRILLCSIESAANRHGRFITPLVSISVDFYIRVFVKVEASAQKVKLSTSKLAIVYCCNGCENFHFQPMGTQVTVEQKTHFKNSRGPPVGPICDNCGGTFTMGGPIWTNPIHSRDFVLRLQQSLRSYTQLEVTDLPDFEAQRRSLESREQASEIDKLSVVTAENSNNNNNNSNISNNQDDCNRGVQKIGRTTVERGRFQTLRRMQGIVNVISEELLDVPLHYTQEKLSQVLRSDTVPMIKLRSAIMNAGYRVSSSHTNRTSVKTDAPSYVIWDIMRHWVKSRKIVKSAELATRQIILSHSIKTSVNFNERQDAIAPSMKDKSLRYQNNPERNWGPKARATATDEIEEKRKRLQGKKKRHRTNANNSDANQQNNVNEPREDKNDKESQGSSSVEPSGHSEVSTDLDAQHLTEPTAKKIKPESTTHAPA
ncbi:probable tRNA (guanine(26)-N(2))-dimethyltransferase isoform X3 [Varroa destructor]|nr:probable tRNA (guanine(26)-N(2))-dimethyltransferase isoform X3 [Varroa destructor]